MPNYTYTCILGHVHERSVAIAGRNDYMLCPIDGHQVQLQIGGPALRFYASPDEFMAKNWKPKDYDTADREALLTAEGREHLI